MTISDMNGQIFNYKVTQLWHQSVRGNNTIDWPINVQDGELGNQRLEIPLATSYQLQSNERRMNRFLCVHPLHYSTHKDQNSLYIYT